MLKKYKRQQRNAVEEIEKLNKLILVKDNEITNLNMDLSSLGDFRSGMDARNQAKVDQALKMIEENKAVIKRQDKLIVDLQQKNEVCQITIAQTEEDALKRSGERTALQVRLKELEDFRSNYDGNINLMERKLKAYREHLIAEQQREAEIRKQQLKEAKRIAAEQKANQKGKKRIGADGEPIYKSSLSRKSGSLILNENPANNTSGNIKSSEEQK